MLGRSLALAGLLGLAPLMGIGQEICQGFGPQTPRDIASKSGMNTRAFNLAPQPWAMNLCNIHTHTNAEHKGPGFSLPADKDHAKLDAPGQILDIQIIKAASGHDAPTDPAAPADPAAAPAAGGAHAIEKGGWRCNETVTLSTEDRVDPWGGHGPFGNVAPGDTIEVHWVFTSCDVEPGPTLGACLSEACVNPQLRVESQVFLVVNDPSAPSFSSFVYAGTHLNGRPQPVSLPSGTGEPVVFRGSTTGTKYDQHTCSPYQVTWSVRPYCMRINLLSLHAWAAAGNVFEETASHGVRPLVTAPELLGPID